MGNGSSCSGKMMRSSSMTTVKLILLDGELKEFYAPVKVHRLLDRKDSEDSFICNSDEMEFDGFVKAINGDEELQVGQLYFELPISKLTRPLQAEEMVALAVKATTALRRSHRNVNETEHRCWCGTGGFYSKRVDPGFVFYNNSSIYNQDNHHHHHHHNSSSDNKTAEQHKDTVMFSVKKKKVGMLGNYISGKFTGKLSAILEEQQQEEED